MDNNEKYDHWEDIARYDLETAEAMLHSGRYLYVAFMCQQAIEKLVKGLFVWHKDEEPPRTHNIYSIYKAIYGDDSHNKERTEQEKKYTPFFAQLLAYYISERYPSYKEKLSATVTREKAVEVLSMAREVFLWLQSLKQ
ncbi:MAG TPA: HEPN domain-containing protein [Bacilli bacterium]